MHPNNGAYLPGIEYVREFRIRDDERPEEYFRINNTCELQLNFDSTYERQDMINPAGL